MTSGDPSTSPLPDALRCAECGERIRPGRRAGTFTHVARLVAACDLDSDHRPEPASTHTDHDATGPRRPSDPGARRA